MGLGGSRGAASAPTAAPSNEASQERPSSPLSQPPSIPLPLGVDDRNPYSELHVLSGHRDIVRALCVTFPLFSLHPPLLVTASDDGRMYVWNTDSGSRTFVLRGHRQPVTCLHAVPSAPVLFSGSLDRSVCLWSLVDGRLLKQHMDAHAGAVKCFVSLHHARIVCSGGADRMLRLWDVSTGDPLATVTRRDFETVSCMLALNESTVAVAASADGIQVYRFSKFSNPDTKQLRVSGDCVETLCGHDGIVHTMIILDDSHFATAACGADVRIWHRHTLAPVAVVHLNPFVGGPVDPEQVFVHSLISVSDAPFFVASLGRGFAIIAMSSRTVKAASHSRSDNDLSQAYLGVSSSDAFKAQQSERRTASEAVNSSTMMRRMEYTVLSVIRDAHLSEVSAMCVVERRKLVTVSEDALIHLWDLSVDTDPELQEYFSHDNNSPYASDSSQARDPAVTNNSIPPFSNSAAGVSSFSTVGASYYPGASSPSAMSTPTPTSASSSMMSTSSLPPSSPFFPSSPSPSTSRTSSAKKRKKSRTASTFPTKTCYLGTLSGHAAGIKHAVAVSQNSFVTAGRDGSVFLWRDARIESERRDDNARRMMASTFDVQRAILTRRERSTTPPPISKTNSSIMDEEAEEHGAETGTRPFAYFEEDFDPYVAHKT